MMRGGKRHPAEEAITIVIGAAPKGETEEAPEEEIGEYEPTEEDEEMERMLRRMGA